MILKIKSKTEPYLYSAPALIVIALVMVLPIIYTVYISFTNMNVYHWKDFKFIGFKNYQKALFMLDSGFLMAFLRTVLWTAVNIILQLIISFLIAVLLNVKGLKLSKLYKTFLMFPWAMPGYVSILLWKMGMFNTEYGFLNHLLQKLGISKINWLSGNFTAFVSCIILNLWLALPFMIMIIDGALQSVDKCYYESAKLEGANFWNQTRYITIPLIKPIIAPMVMMTLFTTFKQFDIVYLLTQQNGSKTGADIHTVLTYAYENAFITNNYGYSSAVSIIIFLILLVYSIFNQKDIRGEA